MLSWETLGSGPLTELVFAEDCAFKAVGVAIGSTEKTS